jgi:hypothetical protein
MLHGFINQKHRNAFSEAAAEHGRGGASAKHCGARTRSGGTCKMAPLKGHWRCLRHAGPAAARVHRDRQLRELAAGRLDPTVFNRAEQRRAANRLRWEWRKHGPWVPGSTIDLGAQEAVFAEHLAGAGFQFFAIPPAVIDWLRWRFRRHYLDRRSADRWAASLADARTRIREAGPAPTFPVTNDGNRVAAAPFATPRNLPTWSRRRQPDKPRRMPKAVQLASKLPPEPAEDLWELLRIHRADLAPVLARCESDSDRLRIAVAYRDVLTRCSGAHTAWLSTLKSLDSPSAE